MRRVNWSPLADDDTLEQADRIAKDNPRAARRFLIAARETADNLAEMPELGAAYEADNPRLAGLRVLPVKGFRNHLLFYRFTDQTLDVVRLIYGTRDLPKALGG